jgi:hypothetical protein
MRGAALLVLLCAVADAEEPSAPQLFKRGVEALRAEDYAGAAAAFAQSYALSPKAATVCNLALTYDRWSGHVAEAIESYRKCAEDDASGRFRDHALERARELRALVAATPKPEPPPPPPPVEETKPPPPPPPPAPAPVVAPPPVVVAAPPPPERRARPFFKDPAACVLAALGVAAVGTGVGLVVAGKLADNQVAGTADLGQKASLYDRAGVLQPAGYVMLGAGVALIVAGVVEWAAHGRHSSPHAHAARGAWSF